MAGVSQKVMQQIQAGSWIRKMFEEGDRLKQQFGEENVYDLTLGNPDIPPPEEVLEAIERVATKHPDKIHTYMPNSGYPEVREKIASQLKAWLGLPFEANNIIMTVGAAGALNVALKSILEPGNEVIVFAPFFPEYAFYVDNHQGRLVVVQTDERLNLDFDALKKAINANTKAVILNSPNNPTGVMVKRDELEELARVLKDASARIGHPIYLLSDEPYRALIFEGKRFEPPVLYYENTLILYSYSKEYSLAGERIGYIAISPGAEDAKDIFDAATFVNRTLGFVNAPALMQRVIGSLEHVKVDVGVYEERSRIMYEGLKSYGYDVVKPDGTFYLFVKSPLRDDMEFVRYMQREKHVLVTPGSGFGRKGYFRIALCVDKEVLQRSLKLFEEAARELKGQNGI